MTEGTAQRTLLAMIRRRGAVAMAQGALVAVDAGGTHTRVLVVDGAGTFLASRDGAACNPGRFGVEASVSNAASAIRDALQAANCSGRDIQAFVAGIAGLTDTAWADQITDAVGIGCRGHFIGDHIVGQVGAFGGGPGIIFCAGTGSVAFGITESGRHLSNYDFGHFAPAGAGMLVWETLIRIAAGDATPEDHPWVDDLLSGLSLADIPALRTALTARTLPERLPRLAPAVTAGAERGVPLAQSVCNDAARHLAGGVRIVLPAFERRPVRCAPVGSVAGSPYMLATMRLLLAQNPDCEPVLPLYPPVVGAVILALQRQGTPVDPQRMALLAAREGVGAGVPRRWETPISLADPAKERLRRLLPTLMHREQEMATRLFGLDGSQPLTRLEAAAFFHVTVERIDQVQLKLRRLAREDAPLA